MCSVSSRLRHDAAAVMHQVRQHAELVAGQLHRRAVDASPRAMRGSSATAPQRSSGATWPLRAADQRAQPRQHFLHPERLGDVVVGAAVDALHLLVPAAARGQHEHRHGQCRLAPARSSVRPSTLGQAEIEHDRVVALGLPEKVGALAVAGESTA